MTVPVTPSVNTHLAAGWFLIGALVGMALTVFVVCYLDSQEVEP